MTDATIDHVLTLYEQLLANEQAEFWQGPYAGKLTYCREMLPQMREWAGSESDRNREKLMRWLGFVQGAFWVCGVYSINQMRDHNRTPR